MAKGRKKKAVKSALKKGKNAPQKKGSKPSKKAKHNVGKSTDKEYKSIYQKIYRRKQKKDEIVKGKKKGWKTKRSIVYKEIVELNKKIVELCRKKKYAIPDSIKLRKAKIEKAKKFKARYNPKQGIKEKCTNIWKFEEILAGFLKIKKFKTIYLKDIGKKFDKKTPPSEILYWYDIARDKAYEHQFAGTPMVCYIEDSKNSILTIEITS